MTDKEVRALPVGADRCVGPDGLRASVGKRSIKLYYRPKGLPQVPIGPLYAKDAPKTLEQAEAEGRYTLEQARQVVQHLKNVKAAGIDPREYRLKKIREAGATQAAETKEDGFAAFTVEKLCNRYDKRPCDKCNYSVQ